MRFRLYSIIFLQKFQQNAGHIAAVMPLYGLRGAGSGQFHEPLGQLLHRVWLGLCILTGDKILLHPGTVPEHYEFVHMGLGEAEIAFPGIRCRIMLQLGIDLEGRVSDQIAPEGLVFILIRLEQGVVTEQCAGAITA